MEVKRGEAEKFVGLKKMGKRKEMNTTQHGIRMLTRFYKLFSHPVIGHRLYVVTWLLDSTFGS